MLPIRDRNPTDTFPYITYMLIGINVLVFLFELLLDSFGQLNAFIGTWGMIPSQVMDGNRLFTLLTSMFMHGGFMHIFGNMLYLYIFGNNIEDTLGHLGYLAFYIFSGLCASLLHILLVTNPNVPTLGASGAIAGVLGAYLILFPKAKVDTLIFFFFITWVTIPAFALLVFWFFLQLFSGALSIVSTGSTGVAYFAHVGGFIAGALIALPFRGRVSPIREPRRFRTFSREDEDYWY